MNLSNIITRVKLKLGLINIATPFVNLDEAIVEIINSITLPDFSIYYPAKETIRIHTKDLQRIEKEETYETFLLPEFKERKLLYVFDVTYDDSCLSGLGYYGGGMPLIAGSTINQAMLANASANLISMMLPKLTFEFIAPRTLRIWNMYSSSKLKIDMGMEHDKSLATIPDTCRGSFLDLLILDVKDNLYPTFKQYSEINTAIGNINLKIDDWANAESERKDLINQWNDTYHLDLPNPQYYY